MPTPAEYRAIIVASRKQQLQLTADNVRRMLETYTRAAESLAAQIPAIPAYMLTEQGAIQQVYQERLIASIDSTILSLAQDYKALLDAGMLELAQSAADREARVAAMLGHFPDPRLRADLSRSYRLSDGAMASASFGQLARTAVDRVANRYYSDGLKLSDRLYSLTDTTRKTVEDTILHGIAEQVSAEKMGERLRDSLAAAGSENPTYHAMRIARTEINSAHREAHIQSAMTEGGALKPYITGIRWNLSLSHGAEDICDIYAEADVDGLGSGLYLPYSYPDGHPNCLCYSTSELADFPGLGAGAKPDVGAVPRSQVDYYATQGDRAAEWAQQQDTGGE